MDIDINILNKILATKSKNTSKDHPRWSSRLHPSDVGIAQHKKIHLRNKLKDKEDHLIRCWTSLSQNPTPFHCKSLGEIRSIWNISNIKKVIYSTLTANIKLNGEKLKAIPLKEKTRQGCPLSPYLFNIVLKVLAIAIR